MDNKIRKDTNKIFYKIKKSLGNKISNTQSTKLVDRRIQPRHHANGNVK